jgi:hypothetical protein
VLRTVGQLVSGTHITQLAGHTRRLFFSEHGVQFVN